MKMKKANLVLFFIPIFFWSILVETNRILKETLTQRDKELTAALARCKYVFLPKLKNKISPSPNKEKEERKKWREHFLILFRQYSNQISSLKQNSTVGKEAQQQIELLNKQITNLRVKNKKCL